jgi:hypothetical protein
LILLSADEREDTCGQQRGTTKKANPDDERSDNQGSRIGGDIYAYQTDPTEHIEQAKYN